MKKIIALLLTIGMVLSLCAVPAVSGTEVIIYGDADGNGVVTIADVNRIQQHLVDIDPPIAPENIKGAIVTGDRKSVV